jgi:hypothetical protein
LDAAKFATEGTGFLRVNHYNAVGGGYMHKHMDSQKCFGPVIACCSLLADAAITFYDTKGNSYGMARVHRTAEVSIPRRSLYFMSGPARFQWQHGIRKDQCLRERLSLTFRTVRGDAPITGTGRTSSNRLQKKVATKQVIKRPAKSDSTKQVIKRPAKSDSTARRKNDIA